MSSSVRFKALTNNVFSGFIAYEPPYDWLAIKTFFKLRQLEHNEIIRDNCFAKCILVCGQPVTFEAKHDESKMGFFLKLWLSNAKQLENTIAAVKKILDLDAKPKQITQALLATGLPKSLINEGIRIPRIYNRFEAAMRAVLGQQVSVKAAVTQVNLLHSRLMNLDAKRDLPIEQTQDLKNLLTANEVANAELDFLKMPQARKDSLKRLASLLMLDNNASEEACLALKGIGPWTVNYINLRNKDRSDIFLESDLVVKKQLKQLHEQGIDIKPALAGTYQTYLTFFFVEPIMSNSVKSLAAFNLSVLKTPVGYLDIYASEEGLKAVKFADSAKQERPNIISQQAHQQLSEYIQGNRKAFDLPLDADGTDFQKRVWQQLMTVEYGAISTYLSIAKKLGNPSASRAIGMANGKNPISIIVPCHRIIGSNGKLTGYAGGLPRKTFLLDLESKNA